MEYHLAKACHGKSLSQGGMNITEFRKFLITMYPNHSVILSRLRRKQLENFCLEDPIISEDIKASKKAYFKKNTTLNCKKKSNVLQVL